MGFLQPLMLAALPLIALPIIIHLINQRRYQTIPWAAMMFLLAANRMSRGYARIRQWLILAMRVLAVAGLIFAISRPLMSGWLAISGGADATLILLDRSPSMRQQAAGTVTGKLETGCRQLAQMLSLFSSARWELIDSATNAVHELQAPEALNQVPESQPTSATADIPALLQTAYNDIQTNNTGRSEIWICSDLRKNDWDPDSGRWKSLRDAFLQLPQGIRFHLLAYPDSVSNNLAVRVTGVKRRETADQAELLISFQITQESAPAAANAVPVQFEIDGARSEISVELTSRTVDVQDHRIPLERTQQRGWGKISLPADANPADNDFYFVFDRPAPRQTLIVGDGGSGNRALELAAGISPDPSIEEATETITADQVGSVDWENTALVLWHAPLPEADAASALQTFVDRGGQVIFFAPPAPNANEFQGVRWESWMENANPMPIENWRTDQDLLSNTVAGVALPVGQLEIYRYCRMTGEVTPLVMLQGESPLLTRVATTRGGVYFCATTPSLADSSLATEGVVFYVMVQRALAAGAAGLGNVRDVIAGDVTREQTAEWTPVAVPDTVLSTDYAFHSGVFAAGEKLIAVNRAVDEDHAPVLDDARVQELFQGLDFTRVDDQAGSLHTLIEEVWRIFLIIMMAALLLESALCLPRSTATTVGNTSPLVRGFDDAQPANSTAADWQPTGGAA